MEPSTPPEQTPPTNPEPETNPVPPTEPVASGDQAPSPAPPEAVPAPAGNKLPSAFSLFKPSWEAVKLNIKAFIILGIVPYLAGFALALIFGFSNALFGKHHAPTGLTIVPVLLILTLIAFFLVLAPALIYTQVQSINGNKVNPGNAFSVGKRLWLRFFGLSIVMSLIIGVGFLLLIVPGLFLLRRYILAPYFLVDKELSINEALNQSAAFSKKYSGAVWGLIGVTILISLLGIIPVLGGIASAILGIAYYCAPALRYKEVTTGVPSVTTK